MIKLLTIIGARPQIIKASAISRAIRNHFSNKIREVIVHTGQHYDAAMSGVFFEELGLPKENYNLQVGSGSHAVQTSLMMMKIEELLVQEKPDAVLLYGDTNSTLAASVAASKLHLPIVHVEGGVRSFNKKYPEEVNRIICDHLSTLIFVPTQHGIDNLEREGLSIKNQPPYTLNNTGVFFCGDIMYDNSIYFGKQVESRADLFKKFDVGKEDFALVTIHRPHNVDDPAVLSQLLATYVELSERHNIKLIFPIHPRTLKILETNVDASLKTKLVDSNIKMIPPVSFIEMTFLEKMARLVCTDSGGVQKEAYYFHKPCVIMLEETPWPELVESGTARATGSDSNKVKEAFSELIAAKDFQYPNIFGDGHAAEFICGKIVETFG